jgi:hypothetical protein
LNDAGDLELALVGGDLSRVGAGSAADFAASR